MISERSRDHRGRKVVDRVQRRMVIWSRSDSWAHCASILVVSLVSSISLWTRMWSFTETMRPTRYASAIPGGVVGSANVASNCCLVDSR